MILRLCFTWKIEVYSYTEAFADRLDEFFDIYVDPFYEASPIVSHRKMIRDSPHLNKLLFDNIHGLRLIFEKNKVDGYFNLTSGKTIFMGLTHQEIPYILTDTSLEECFVYSLMAVTIEQNKMRKYKHLLFVEFLEFLCRIAIVGLDVQDLVEYKVHILLEMAY